MLRQRRHPTDGGHSPDAHGRTRPVVDAPHSAGRRPDDRRPRRASLVDALWGHRVTGWLRAVAGSRPAAWIAGGLLAAVALGQAWQEGLPVVGPLGAALVLSTLPLAWSWSRPVAAAYLLTAGACGYAFLDVVKLGRAELVLTHAGPLVPVVLVAPVIGGLAGMHLLVRHGRRHVRWPVLVVTAGMLGILVRDDLAGLAILTIAVGIVALDAARSRVGLLRERAAALEWSVADQRREAVAMERARIARELHDLVAHSVSVIAVQAELLPPTIPGLPQQARAGFEQIARSARSAMTELRQMLDVLRQGETTAELSPLPSLAQLGELADQHRAAGGSVELRTHGEPRPLPALVELSAYRVVQEALTNTRKHAPGSHARVDVSYAPDRLTVRIADDGPATGAARPDLAGGTVGFGLVGMHERVTMLGGRLRTGPQAWGGFEVTAALPLPVAPLPGVQPREPQPQAPRSAPEAGG